MVSTALARNINKHHKAKTLRSWINLYRRFLQALRIGRLCLQKLTALLQNIQNHRWTFLRLNGLDPRTQDQDPNQARHCIMISLAQLQRGQRIHDHSHPKATSERLLLHQKTIAKVQKSEAFAIWASLMLMTTQKTSSHRIRLRIDLPLTHKTPITLGRAMNSFPWCSTRIQRLAHHL